ncbi:hypothetical protein QF019_006274, partial [Pseudomonas frederiksbergensis]
DSCSPNHATSIQTVLPVTNGTLPPHDRLKPTRS